METLPAGDVSVGHQAIGLRADWESRRVGRTGGDPMSRNLAIFVIPELGGRHHRYERLVAQLTQLDPRA